MAAVLGSVVRRAWVRPRSLGIALALPLLSIVPACSSSPAAPRAAVATTTTSTTSSVTLPEQSPAVVAACTADAKTVEIAIDAYMAQKGVNPAPPLPWSAANYVSQYQPLTADSAGGPYLPKPPGTTSYVIEYDAAGHVWIAPPGQYGATYNPGQDFDAHPDICLPAAN